MESEAERLERELEELYAERDKTPNRSSFKRIVLTITLLAILPYACGTYVTGISPFHPFAILFFIGLVLVGSFLVKGMSLVEDKGNVDKEIAEKTATLANLRSIKRDSEK